MAPQTMSAPQVGDANVLLELAPDAIFVADPDGCYTYVNKAAGELLGWTREELLGMAVKDLIESEAIPRVQQDRERMLAGESTRGEWRMRRHDGTWVDVEMTANILPTGQWQAYVRSLEGEKRQQASEAHTLAQAERERAWLQAVTDRLPVGMLLFQHGGRAQFNAKAQELLELTGETGGALGHAYASRVFHVDGRPVRVEEFPSMRAFAGDESAVEPTRYRIRRKDGSETQVLASAAPLRGAAGGLLGAVVVLQDVTHVVELEHAVREKEQLLRAVFDLLPVGVYVAGKDGRILLHNPVGERIWKGARDGAGGYHEYKGWWVESGEPVQAHQWGMARALRTGETSGGELVRIECFDGSQKTVINWAAPLRAANGEITGAVGVNEDVTSLQRAQEELRVAVQDREHILAVVAHDLRSPLSSLSLRAAALEVKAQRLADGGDLAPGIAAIGSTARGMAGLVDDLLSVSVRRSGQGTLALAPLPAHAVIAAAAEAAEPRFLAEGLRLVVEPDSELPAVVVDAPRIQRVFTNLLDNALKFTHKSGKVRLRARRVGEGVEFTVANSGPPLEPEQVRQLFQPFWQATCDSRGAGLGLSICRSIIEAHGGSIRAEAAEGMRVKIRVTLPCAPPMQAAPEARSTHREFADDAGTPAR